MQRVRLIEKQPGIVRVDHREGEHDDHVISLGIAATWLLDRTPTNVPAAMALEVLPDVAGWLEE